MAMLHESNISPWTMNHCKPVSSVTCALDNSVRQSWDTLQLKYGRGLDQARGNDHPWNQSHENHQTIAAWYPDWIWKAGLQDLDARKQNKTAVLATDTCCTKTSTCVPHLSKLTLTRDVSLPYHLAVGWRGSQFFADAVACLRWSVICPSTS